MCYQGERERTNNMTAVVCVYVYSFIVIYFLSQSWCVSRCLYYDFPHFVSFFMSLQNCKYNSSTNNHMSYPT